MHHRMEFKMNALKRFLPTLALCLFTGSVAMAADVNCLVMRVLQDRSEIALPDFFTVKYRTGLVLPTTNPDFGGLTIKDNPIRGRIDICLPGSQTAIETMDVRSLWYSEGTINSHRIHLASGDRLFVTCAPTVSVTSEK